MSTTIPLPPTLQERIAGVARRVRVLRAVRGVSLLVLVLALTAGAALLADFLLDGNLPVAIRGVNLALWTALGSLLLTACLVLPLRRKLDAADLAAVIEEKHPQLGERLTSSVELCERSDLGNGSPALIELLVRETEARASPSISSRPSPPGARSNWRSAPPSWPCSLSLPLPSIPPSTGCCSSASCCPGRCLGRSPTSPSRSSQAIPSPPGAGH
jgi:hypothetical protein